MKDIYKIKKPSMTALTRFESNPRCCYLEFINLNDNMPQVHSLEVFRQYQYNPIEYLLPSV